MALFFDCRLVAENSLYLLKSTVVTYLIPVDFILLFYSLPIGFVCRVNYLPSSVLDGPTFPELGVTAVFCCIQSTSYAGSTTDLVTDIHVQSSISGIML